MSEKSGDAGNTAKKGDEVREVQLSGTAHVAKKKVDKTAANSAVVGDTVANAKTEKRLDQIEADFNDFRDALLQPEETPSEPSDRVVKIDNPAELAKKAENPGGTIFTGGRFIRG
jgi:hypothetical protein